MKKAYTNFKNIKLVTYTPKAYLFEVEAHVDGYGDAVVKFWLPKFMINETLSDDKEVFILFKDDFIVSLFYEIDRKRVDLYKIDLPSFFKKLNQDFVEL